MIHISSVRTFLARRLLSVEGVVYVLTLLFLAVFFVLQYQNDGSTSVVAFAQYYARLMGPETMSLLTILVFAVYIRVSVLWIQAERRKERFSIRQYTTLFPTLGKNLLFGGIPALVALYAMTMMIGQLNVFNTSHLKNELLFEWDVFATGTFPSFSLLSVVYPQWLAQGIIFSFTYLGALLAVVALYWFATRYDLFRRFAAAYLLSIVFMMPGWLLVPVLSPHDRYIVNVYDDPIPAHIQSYVDDFNPQDVVATALQRSSERKEGLSVYPTTALPSAHVAWATIFVYYAYQFRRWLAVPAFVFAALSSAGTVFLAQHYFLDLPTGILAGVATILTVEWIFRHERPQEEAPPQIIPSY